MACDLANLVLPSARAILYKHIQDSLCDFSMNNYCFQLNFFFTVIR